MFILCQGVDMFGWFRKNKKQSIEDRLAILEANLVVEREATLEATEKLEEANKELSVLREKQQQYDDKRNSTEPWIEVVGESIDPVRGIEIRLDWNDAFIQYLKENGITGKDEDTAVQKYVAFLYQDLIEKFEQRIIDNSDKQTVSDYI